MLVLLKRSRKLKTKQNSNLVFVSHIEDEDFSNFGRAEKALLYIHC